MRRTRQQEAIEEVLRKEQHPLLPDEIHRLAIRHVPSLGIATVYRSLKSLRTAGQINCVEIPGNPPRYERADKGHHHYFHCRTCNLVFDLPSCPGNLKQLAPSGFVVTDHEIILQGHCKCCAA